MVCVVVEWLVVWLCQQKKSSKIVSLPNHLNMIRLPFSVIWIIGEIGKRLLTSFVSRSFTVRLTSCFTGWDMLLQSSWISTSKTRVETYSPYRVSKYTLHRSVMDIGRTRTWRVRERERETPTQSQIINFFDICNPCHLGTLRGCSCSEASGRTSLSSPPKTSSPETWDPNTSGWAIHNLIWGQWFR